MILLTVALAALTEFGTDAYPEIGIVKTEEVEIVDPTPDVECEEGETWRTVVREELQVEVTPKEERRSSQSCLGHEIEVAREDKGLVWFHNKSTAEELAAQARRRMQDDPELKSSLVQTVSKNKLYGVTAHFVHKDGSFACSHCRFQSAEKPGQEWEGSRVYRCPGHWYQHGGHKIYSDKDDSEKRRQKVRAKLSEMRNTYRADPRFAASDFYLHQFPHEDAMDFDIHGWYRHQDKETKPCQEAVEVYSYTLPPKISERWVADKAFEPNCPCIREINGQAETRMFGGTQVSRDSWKRVRVFECAKEQGSRCEACRKEGGTLVSKQCIRKEGDGRCVRWKKVYDMKKHLPYTKRIHQFEEGRELYGFNGEFDSLKERQGQGDFARTFAAILGAAASFSSEEDAKQGLLYQGRAVETREELSDERCHFVGLRMDGVDDVKFVYCCFASKIAKIIQEGAKGSWGNSALPDCGALKECDLETADLSEMHDSLIDRGVVEKIQKRMAGR